VYNRWKFTILLTTLIALLVLSPLLERRDSASWFYKLMLIIVFFGSFFVLFPRRKSRVAAVVLGVPTVMGIVFHSYIPATSPIIASLFYHLIPIVLCGYTVVVILRTIFHDAVVSTDSINGAFAGYLLLGLMFGHVYCLVETVDPDSFDIQTNFKSIPNEEWKRHMLLSYFSVITLTTVGYGDITPRSNWARNFACVEAIIGQFYMAVIVAELIALRVSEAFAQKQTRPNSTSDLEQHRQESGL
jgi:voltage-gated potassium channel